MPMNFYKFEKFKRAELPCHKVGQEKRATVFGENEGRLSICDSIHWVVGDGLLCVNSPNPTQCSLKAGGVARGRRLHLRLPQSLHSNHGVDATTQAHQKPLPAR
jgi:hypothetical protein